MTKKRSNLYKALATAALGLVFAMCIFLVLLPTPASTQAEAAVSIVDPSGDVGTVGGGQTDEVVQLWQGIVNIFNRYVVGIGLGIATMTAILSGIILGTKISSAPSPDEAAKAKSQLKHWLIGCAVMALAVVIPTAVVNIILSILISI